MPSNQRRDPAESNRAAAAPAPAPARREPAPESDHLADGRAPPGRAPYRCFVIMPSGNHGEYEKGPRESDFIYNDIIRPAAAQALGDDIVIHREADKRVPGAITREIVKHAA